VGKVLIAVAWSRSARSGSPERVPPGRVFPACPGV